MLTKWCNKVHTKYTKKSKRLAREKREAREKRKQTTLPTFNENIGNHGYIDTLILRIYRRYINKYFEKKFWLTKN